MYSPIRNSEIQTESCDAHLIPDALGASSKTVVSERDLDNRIGAMNDCELVRFVENTFGPEKDVAVAFFDEKTERMLHRSSIRRPSTIKTGIDGLRTGKIDFGRLTDGLRARIGLGVGALCRITPYSPSHEDCCRIGLSMLHSGFLTMYYHFGTQYSGMPEAERIRRIILMSADEKLPSEAEHAGARQWGITAVLKNTINPKNFDTLASEMLRLNPHAVSVWNFSTFSCFGVLLPYHPRFKTICFLPGVGDGNAERFWRRMSSIDGHQVFPDRIVSVVPRAHSTQEPISQFWQRGIRHDGRKDQRNAR